jgi:hypothetical protein
MEQRLFFHFEVGGGENFLKNCQKFSSRGVPTKKCQKISARGAIVHSVFFTYTECTFSVHKKKSIFFSTQRVLIFHKTILGVNSEENTK